MTAINTAAENSMKLTFLITLGLNSMRTAMKDQIKLTTTTNGINHRPKGSKNVPISDISSVFMADMKTSNISSVSLLTV